MTASRTIGVTATSLGLFAPPAFSGMMRNAVGTRNAELALMRGQLFTSEDALEIGWKTLFCFVRSWAMYLPQ